MAGKVILLGTLDTKGAEFKFVKDIVEDCGIDTLTVNAGVKGKPYFTPDISNEEVARTGGSTLAELLQKDDRGFAMDVMTKGAARIVTELAMNKEVAGILSLGGSAGTTIGATAMQALPVGIPKLMVSTMASGDTRSYVGVKDICMMYSVTDISGLNTISRKILANAAFAIAGMAKGEHPIVKEDKVLLGASMFGVTTPCVTSAREYLEQKGYEVLIFHATGSGGRAMEELIKSGFIKGVLDVTTTEWCDELVGGVLSAGPHRLEAAGQKGVPQVVSVGALDMVNFGPPETVPQQFDGRKFYPHNPTVTLMRTTVKENIELGKIMAAKLNASTGPVALFLPLKGVSLIDREGQPFYGPEEDKALFETLRHEINPEKVELIEIDTDINDPEFARAMADKLIALLKL